MPIKAMFTRSFALINGFLGMVLAFAGIQKDGITDAAEKAKALFKKFRRDISDFMVE